MIPSNFKSNKVGKSSSARQTPTVIKSTPGNPVGYSKPDFNSGLIESFSRATNKPTISQTPNLNIEGSSPGPISVTSGAGAYKPSLSGSDSLSGKPKGKPGKPGKPGVGGTKRGRQTSIPARTKPKKNAPDTALTDDLLFKIGSRIKN